VVVDPAGPVGAGRDMMTTAEGVYGLKIPLPDVVSMQCRQESLEGTGEIKLRRLVKEALRMRPSRIIVGEVRQEESLDLLIALNSRSRPLRSPTSFVCRGQLCADHQSVLVQVYKLILLWY
jgi:hypothetical protein